MKKRLSFVVLAVFVSSLAIAFAVSERHSFAASVPSSSVNANDAVRVTRELRQWFAPFAHLSEANRHLPASGPLFTALGLDESLLSFGVSAGGGSVGSGDGFDDDDADDPDMPAIFKRSKADKQKFMLRRFEGIAQKRGIEKGKSIDPQARSRAILQMESQEAEVVSRPDSSERSALLSTWTPLGPAPIPNGQTGTTGVNTPVSGRTVAIAVHPTNPNIVYAGTAQGGLYRTTDGGANWTPLMDNAQSLAIGAIAIAPSQPDTIYVGTGEIVGFFGVGVYRIDNASGGAPIVTGPLNKNSSNADIFSGNAIASIAVHPTDPATIFVASAQAYGGIGTYYSTPGSAANKGVYRSTNATSANPVFTQIGPLGAPNNNFSVYDIAIDPQNPNFLVANLVVNNGGIYVSTNALSATPTFVNRQALTGTNGAGDFRTEFAIQRSPGAPNPTIYAATGNGDGRVLRSTDGGVTWTERIDNNFCNPQCFYDVAVAVDPTDPNKVYLGGSPALVFAYSNDGGSSFTKSDLGLHVDSHAIAVAPSQPSTIYFGSDGGIYKSTNGGLAWQVLNTAQYSATQFMSIAVHPTDPNFTIGGTQDNGTNHYRTDGSWNRIDFGDGGYSMIDQNTTSTSNVRMYHTYFNDTDNLLGYGTVSNVASASDGSWEFRGCGAPGTTRNGITCTGDTLFYAPLASGPGNPNTVYYGSDRLYRSADTGLNHTVASQAPIQAGVPISAIGISRQNDNVRIVGLSNGGLWGTSTGSATLTNLDSGGAVPNSFIARAVVDPNNQNTAYVTLSATGVVNVWRTNNLSSGSPTWTAAAGTGATSIPRIPVSAFLIDPTNSNSIYAGTDIGVYASTDGGATWAPFGTGLPRLPIFDMAVAPGTPRRLRIATHGRGLWDIDMPAAAAPSISINDVSLNEGNTGTTPFTFTATLSAPSQSAVTVNFATANGTATAGSDYMAATGTITFNANETSKHVTVQVTGDTVVEPDENFFVNLSNANGATIANNQGVGLITNDDSAPTPPPSPTPTPADGDTDPDFVSRLVGGMSEGTGTQYSTVRDLVTQPDGKTVLVGEFISFASRLQRGVARINADGSPDYAFRPNVNGDVWTVALQPDGKIVIGGTFTQVGGLTYNRVARLNADGSVDSTFQNPNVSAKVGIVAMQNGKILIGGDFANVANQPSAGIARLMPDGSRDTTFSSVFSAGNVKTIIVINGAAYVGGSLPNFRGGFGRLNDNGSLDTSFTGLVSNGVTHAVSLGNGKILVGGPIAGGIRRIDLNGNEDSTFTVSGVSISTNDFLVQSDGKIVASGFVSGGGPAGAYALVRLGQNGEFDPSFMPAITTGDVYAVTLSSNDRIVAGGNFTRVRGQVRNSLVRFNSDASLDLFPEDISLGSSSSSSGRAPVQAILTQSDGKILVGGYFESAGGVTRRAVVRLNVNGTIDTTFQDPGITQFGYSSVMALAIQPGDGKILVGGDFGLVNGAPRRRIIRLHPNGALDSSFSATVDDEVTAIAVQPSDGKIVIGGRFGMVQGQEHRRMARLNTDGSLDTSFNRGFQTCMPYSIDVLPDGKMLACGAGSGFGSSGLVRYNPNGTIDTTFTIADVGAGTVARSFRTADNKIIIIGPFSTVAGVPRAGIARLNSNGTLDTSFQETVFDAPGGGTFSDAAVEPNGRVIVVGNFRNINGQVRRSIARLNADGTVDPNFVALTAAETTAGPSTVNRVWRQEDGRILVGGDFDSINRVGSDYIARLYNGFTPGCSYSASPADRTFSSAATTSNFNLITGAPCGWTASSSASWLTITSAASGTGPATLNYSVAANTTGAPRTATIDFGGPTGTGSHTVTQQSGNATPTPSPTPTVAPTPTVPPSPTPTVNPGGIILNYTGPTVAIPDNSAAGVNIPVVVGQACTITDLDFRIGGTAGVSDPLSTSAGINHSYVGDLVLKLTAPSGTSVTMINRPNSGGCSSNNFSAITLDDDGGFPSVQNQCGTDTNSAFPSGSFAPANPLSAFDGQSATGSWVLNVSDLAGDDVGSVRAFTLNISCVAIAPSPTPTATVAPSPTPTATVAPSPTPTVGPGNVTLVYSGPAVAIPDNLPAGVNIPVVVSQACTVTDLNFRIDGTAGIADPLSAAVGVNHSWVGDLTFKLTSPSGTAVTMIDRPGVPASTSGCNSNNLSAITLDDDGAFPPIENQCGTGDNAAFPSGTFLPNNLLSAFDGQGALGTWMLNVSDSANQDTGSVRAFTLVISCAGVVPTPTPTVAPSPTPTVAPSPTPTPTPVSCSFAANPTSRSFTSAGGTGTFTVVTGPTCQWTASDFVDWVTITAGSNGTGQQTVTYTVSPNTSTTARSTTIDFGGVGGLAEHAITQSGAAAPSPTPTATVAPSPSPTPTVAPSPTPTATPMIRDGGFERTAANGSNPDWGTTSTTFGTSLCTLDCGTSAAVTPRGGSGWVWFDGATSGAAAEQGTVSQTVTIAPGSTATLTFYMKIAVVRAPTSSVMTVTVDGTVVQTFQEPATAETAYTLRTIDLTPFANGQPRLLSFNYSRPAGATGSDSFLIDDVELQAVTGPTTASMTGRVTTPTGTNLRNVVVSLINEQGVRTTATTSSFGIFSFTGVPTGRTYTMTVASRRYRFAAKTIPLTGNMTNVDFVGLE